MRRTKEGFLCAPPLINLFSSTSYIFPILAFFDESQSCHRTLRGPFSIPFSFLLSLSLYPSPSFLSFLHPLYFIGSASHISTLKLSANVLNYPSSSRRFRRMRCLWTSHINPLLCLRESWDRLDVLLLKRTSKTRESLARSFRISKADFSFITDSHLTHSLFLHLRHDDHCSL